MPQLAEMSPDALRFPGMEPLRVGVIGCGNISSIYLENLSKYDGTTVLSCADLDLDRAQASAEKYGVPRFQSPEDILANDEIDLILNLTVPKAHASVNLAALEHGKHVYVEKPLSLDRIQGLEQVDLARKSGLLIGGAPDTFLGAGLQTCKRLIDEGAIGEPIGVNAFMLCHGHESWHPSPEFYYEQGGGPLFDMGPYYLTALVSLMGSISHVQSLARATFESRRITSQPKRGKAIHVETPTHIAALLQFESGAIGQITTSFDVWHHTMPHIEIYGTEGSLGVPDPNGFGGPVQVRKSDQSEWQDVPLRGPYSQNSRGVGVLDMAYALRRGREARASGALAFHVLDVMQAILESGETRAGQGIESRATRPAPIGPETPEGVLLD